MEGEIVTRASAARRQHFAQQSPLKAISRTTKYRLRKRKRIASESLEDCADITGVADTSDHAQQYLDLPSQEQENPHLDCSEETQQTTDLYGYTHIDHSTSMMSCCSGNDYEPLTELLPLDTSSAILNEDNDEDSIKHTLEIRPEVSSITSNNHPILPSNVLLKRFTVRHHLTKDALSDLLELLSMYSPSNIWPPSVYLFNNQFHSLHCKPIFHYFCSECYSSVTNNNESKCPNSFCQKEFTKRGDISSFIELSLQQQLENLLQRETCLGDRVQNSGRPQKSTKLTDICDGHVYTNFMSKSCSSKNLITVTVNTDGVPVFRSSSFSFWPIHLIVNELPYRLRISKENRLLGGLWYGNSKPDMSLFLKPVVDSLRKLYFEGFKVSLPNGEEFVYHVSVLSCTCDLPARALVMNMVQYNGYYGCSHCKQKGASVLTSNRGRVHSFPYDVENPTGPPRDIREHQKDAQDSINEGSPVFGIKGPSILQALPDFDLFKGMSFDYMHLVLLGVTRKLLQLWFTKPYHAEMWYIGNCMQDIDGLLCLICPPNEIKRTPRSIESTMKYWKAHELKTWLLHYSPVVLNGYLPKDYYQHHLLLVEGIYLLLKDEVTYDDIAQSSRLLHHYCFLFPTLYDERYMTLNVHGLLHLPEIVTNLGPLWAHSCFPFEAANGDLLKYFHGSSGVEIQVTEQMRITQALPLLASVFPKDSREEQLYNKMSGVKNNKEQCYISNDVCVYGKPLPYKLTEEDKLTFQSCNITIPSSSVVTYKKIHLISSGRFIIATPKLKTLRDNSGIIFKNMDGRQCYGQLLNVICFDSSERSIKLCYLLINQLTPASKTLCQDSDTNARLNDHITVSRGKRKTLVHLSSTIDKCIIMDSSSIDGFIYASHIPNYAETE